MKCQRSIYDGNGGFCGALFYGRAKRILIVQGIGRRYRRYTIQEQDRWYRKEFMALTDDLLREMFPIVGECVKVRKLIDEFSGKPEEVRPQVSFQRYI